MVGYLIKTFYTKNYQSYYIADSQDQKLGNALLEINLRNFDKTYHVFPF